MSDDSKKLTFLQSIQSYLFQKLSRFFKSSFMLIVFTIIYIGLEYHAPSAYRDLTGKIFNAKIPSILALFILYTSIWFFILPILTSKFILRDKLKNLGLYLPVNKKKTLYLTLLALLLLIPYMFFFSTLKQFQHFYSFGEINVNKFILIQCVLFPIYYFFEEFFFRGFLFLGLWKRIGLHSFWITELIFTLAHIGKPMLEIFLAMPASLILSYLTLQTKSFYPAALVHCLIGITLSYLVTFQN